MTIKNILVVILFIFLFVFSACTSTTTIKSLPSGSKVYVDGEYKGLTPCTFSDQKPAWAKTKIEIKKNGYKPLTVVIDKGEKFNLAACIGGCLVIVPFIWVLEYKPERTFELDQIN